MMKKLNLAFLYHHHQPFYKDNLTGEYHLPWVALHATKDYYDMVAILDYFPKIKLNFNLVPSLIIQLMDYASGNIKGKFMELSTKPAKELNREDKIFILSNFFTGNWENMIYKHKRYAELFEKRGRFTSQKLLERILHQFTTQDFLDLQVWCNLSWFDPIWRKNDAFIKYMFEKGKNYTEDEKNLLLKKQADVCNETIKKYKHAQEEGKVEITTTPFYHPILPVVCDSNLAKISSPYVRLPENRINFIEDAKEQLKKAVKLYEEVFGKKPNGLWPSEGSVAEIIIPLVYDVGIKWLATDEGILFNSLKVREWESMPRELLYFPYRISIQGKEVSMIFRDRMLSDLIGFVYHRWDAKDAVKDFINRLEIIYKSLIGWHGECLVSVILDGENCWESYPNDGWDFLENLYKTLSETEWIETVRVSDFLEKNPPQYSLRKLWPGSWINSNFNIWIGHEEDNLAWDWLYETKMSLLNFLASNPDKVNSEEVKKAFEEIYIAEGSDWFWWYGDEFSSGFDDVYDYLFRKRLINVYKLLGMDVPEKFFTAIKGRVKRKPRLMPVDLIQPKIDGKVTSYFEWQSAGVCETHTGGATARVSKIISKIYFGFDVENLYLRLDPTTTFEDSKPKKVLFRIDFIKPQRTTVDITINNTPMVEKNLFKKEDKLIEFPEDYACVDKVLEVKIPFDAIGVGIGESIEFFISICDLIDSEEYELERWPYLSTIELNRPSKEFKRLDWVV